MSLDAFELRRRRRFILISSFDGRPLLMLISAEIDKSASRNFGGSTVRSVGIGFVVEHVK